MIVLETVAVKMPENLKEEAEEASREMGYTGLSEFVRNAVRDRVEDRLQLKREIAERIAELKNEYPDTETYSTDEVKEMFGIE